MFKQLDMSNKHGVCENCNFNGSHFAMFHTLCGGKMKLCSICAVSINNDIWKSKSVFCYHCSDILSPDVIVFNGLTHV